MFLGEGRGQNVGHFMDPSLRTIVVHEVIFKLKFYINLEQGYNI